MTARTVCVGPGRVKVLAHPCAVLWLAVLAVDSGAIAAIVQAVTR